MIEAIPPEVEQDLQMLIPELRQLGYTPRRARCSESFGDYLLDLEGPAGRIRITRDRSQYFVDGEREKLEAAGLWKAFNDKAAFSKALLDWLRGV